ncbi:glutamine-hydrolyzing carbamoyl-phosphate synthase small subunit [Peribacillus psychrosaccharolyticus]|uniref:Carbamoyl phosphate synthase small chain n=1 Tax=Peribacillus psychrosaccharolyticus TaxID=1407 RepID=A0A974NPG0_PERPY|nr:carbamoyl phosphate synthase small subunit [Peribacillus psychrosaccharolyticus]MEC2053720.1 carbamoyl phosphate synthase small subunit [Peribacillus psychrosaccharolyticus]MED3742665.1 carbamoyl phosphate synthase small subunit [Peribacillus psychrosaccharolyticus]QQT01609.1 glutamine-hydrolyzing carbamoyl-phosphate synthase small subunit [Peribacillus psychrosaccharolyticus]
MKRQLILEDGTCFIGEGFGADTEKSGEVVFNTGMTGYQEILSDPSYCNQIITMTYPLIGNYGINRDDFESIIPAISGLVVREVAELPSNWRNQLSLSDYLKQKHIPGISGIDTRKLTRIIRKTGTMKGMICGIDKKPEQMLQHLLATVTVTDQVRRVSTKTAYRNPGRGFRVVLVDYGMKQGILRELNDRGCDIIVVPYNTTAEEVLQLHPDGIMLSNGPGDPADVKEGIALIQGVQGKIPLFGICLGHQLFALANGAETEKMKFGHRGSNHPVKDLQTGKVALTSQNHGYTVDEESLSKTELEVTHIALNDGTVEGLKHKTLQAFTVQYHPEASPGPEDANYLFDQFIQMMDLNKTKGELTCQNVQI